MATTVTAVTYDINNNPWTLTIKAINGTTPDKITLTQDGILIEYPSYSIEEPLILPKFTFKILGTPSTTIEQFGGIENQTHSFTLTGVSNGNNCQWKGYLTPDLYSIANTGFDEVVELNGISEIEALKYEDFDLETENMRPIQSCIGTLLSGVGTPVYDLAFQPTNSLNHYVAYRNWSDEEEKPMTKFDVIKHICQFYSLILTQDFFLSTITIRSYAKLWGLTSSPLNYATIKHKGINEMYSNTDTYMSASVVNSILKPEDVVIDLKNDTALENPYTYQLRTWIWKSDFHVNKIFRSWVTYEVRLHVLNQEDMGGDWEFPHYTGTGDPITEWWNPDKVIQSGTQKIPYAGMYDVSYRKWESSSALPGNFTDSKMNKFFLIKTFNRMQGSNDVELVPQAYTYAKYKHEISVKSDDYLLFSGQLGFSSRWNMPSEWHARAGYLDATAWEIAPAQDETIQGIGPANGVNGEWADIAVPVHLAPREFRWKWYISDMFGLVVKFKNLYWNHEEDDWRTIKKINWVPLDNTQGMISEEIAYSIADKYPPRMTPLYESLGSGYALRFGARQNGTGVNNTGNGTLEIELVFKKYEPLRQYPFTYWLQNFNMNIVDGADEVADVKSTPQSPSYEYGNEKKPQYSKITNYLMSSYNNVSSFSQVYTDSDSQNELDTLSYTLPQSNGGSISYFSIEEKPEQHQLRVINQVITGMIILSDIISFNDPVIKSLSVKYKNRLMVRDSMTIDALNSLCTVQWLTRMKNYTQIIGD